MFRNIDIAWPELLLTKWDDVQADEKMRTRHISLENMYSQDDVLEPGVL